jgi:hypothetical protein
VQDGRDDLSTDPTPPEAAKRWLISVLMSIQHGDMRNCLDGAR